MPSVLIGAGPFDRSIPIGKQVFVQYNLIRGEVARRPLIGHEFAVQRVLIGGVFQFLSNRYCDAPR